MAKTTGDQTALFNIGNAGRATHCKRGHRRSADNVSANGTCRECSRAFARECNEKTKAPDEPPRTYDLACARPTRRNPDGRTGTDAGYQAHLKAKEPACGPCMEARYHNSFGRKPPKGRPPACKRSTNRDPEGRTGTFAGYMAHIRVGDSICEPCETASRERNTRLAVDRDATRICAQPTSAYPDGRTGTSAGYGAHGRAGEPACPPCAEANRLVSEKNNRNIDRRAQRKAEYQANSTRYAFSRLYYKHQMAAEQYKEMFVAQGERCAICGTDEPGGRSRHLFHVDHDHSCCLGQYSCPKCWRGLLCAGCNIGLGALGDSPERLTTAANYLLEARKRRSDAETSARAGDAA